MEVQLTFEPPCEPRESPQELLELGRLAQQLTHQIFTIDQLERTLRASCERGVQREIRFRGNPFAGVLAFDLVAAQQIDQVLVGDSITLGEPFARIRWQGVAIGVVVHRTTALSSRA